MRDTAQAAAAISSSPTVDGSGTPLPLPGCEVEESEPESCGIDEENPAADCVEEFAAISESASVSHWVLAAAVLVSGPLLVRILAPVLLELRIVSVPGLPAVPPMTSAFWMMLDAVRSLPALIFVLPVPVIAPTCWPDPVTARPPPAA